MELFLTIVGMALVTYIPRLLPIIVTDRLRLPSWANLWLRSIPYAALGALIFPGIMSVDKSLPWIGLAGGLMAVVLAFIRLHIIYVIIGSIVSVFVLKSYFL